jgi:hypothetical protein
MNVIVSLTWLCTTFPGHAARKLTYTVTLDAQTRKLTEVIAIKNGSPFRAQQQTSPLETELTM